MKSKLTCKVCCGAILTGKTLLADNNHLGQNEHQLKLHTIWYLEQERVYLGKYFDPLALVKHPVKLILI